MSAFIKVWNPHQNPVQVNDDGTSIAGLSDGEVDPGDAIAKSALGAGLIIPINGVVAPTDEGQVANSVEAEAVDAPAPVEEVSSDPVEEEKPKPSRSKPQVSKES